MLNVKHKREYFLWISPFALRALAKFASTTHRISIKSTGTILSNCGISLPCQKKWIRQDHPDSEQCQLSDRPPTSDTFITNQRKRAEKDLSSIPKTDAQNIANAIFALEDGLAGDIKKLTNFSPEYRLRVGKLENTL